MQEGERCGIICSRAQGRIPNVVSDEAELNNQNHRRRPETQKSGAGCGEVQLPSSRASRRGFCICVPSSSGLRSRGNPQASHHLQRRCLQHLPSLVSAQPGWSRGTAFYCMGVWFWQDVKGCWQCECLSQIAWTALGAGESNSPVQHLLSKCKPLPSTYKIKNER